MEKNGAKEFMWHIWDRKQMDAYIDRDLTTIELCIAKKKEIELK